MFLFKFGCLLANFVIFWVLTILVSHNCFPFTRIIMQHHTKTHHESMICPFDFWVKRSKVKVTMHWLQKIVLAHNCFPLQLSSWNFTRRLSVSWWCALLISGLKGQKSRSQCIDNWKWFWCIIAFPLHLQSWRLPMRIWLGLKKLKCLHWTLGVFVSLGQPYFNFSVTLAIYSVPPHTIQPFFILICWVAGINGRCG